MQCVRCFYVCKHTATNRNGQDHTLRLFENTPTKISQIKKLAFLPFSPYNRQAVCMMTVESCAIAMREPCQVRKEAAVSVDCDVLRGRSS